MSSAAHVPRPMSKHAGADPARSAPQPAPQTIRAAGAACAVGIHAPAGAKRRAARKLDIIDRGKWGKSCSLKFGLIVTPVSPKGKAVVVITGSSKSVGFALASAFLVRGEIVVIRSRDRPSGRLRGAVDALGRRAGGSGLRVRGRSAVVSTPGVVERLAAYESRVVGGRVDCGINNAGQAGTRGRLVDLPAKDIVRVVGPTCSARSSAAERRRRSCATQVDTC
jgi:hypothetical protein